jgi:hypothetical protein
MYNLVELLQIWFFLGKLVGQNFWEFFQNYSPATALKTLNRFSLQQVSLDFFFNFHIWTTEVIPYNALN